MYSKKKERSDKG